MSSLTAAMFCFYWQTLVEPTMTNEVSAIFRQDRGRKKGTHAALNAEHYALLEKLRHLERRL